MYNGNDTIARGLFASLEADVARLEERNGMADPSEPRTPAAQGQGSGSAPLPASEKQMAFIASLRRDRDLSGLSDRQMTLVTKQHTRREASEVIDLLLKQPRAVVAPAPTTAQPSSPEPGSPTVSVMDRINNTKVIPGRYAVTGEDGVLRFYKVDRPTEGRWAGFTFLKVQASDDLHPVRNKYMVVQVLEKIAEDFETASKAYGQHIGSCGVCGRTLTDEASREAGIGPVCAQKMGW